jgi:predicted AAA+ superfamily ATPase
MHDRIIQRGLLSQLELYMSIFPAVAILGPRQCGKSTLAREYVRNRAKTVYLDLELPSSRQQLAAPELFLETNRANMVCLDEIQRVPELFSSLRSEIDAHRQPGRFLILGSASRDLIRQSSESLAGRIGYLELTPFLLQELQAESSFRLVDYWLRGGFPDSFLADSDKTSLIWRQNFIRTFLERDIPTMGLHLSAENLGRLWRMCAHCHGQLLNASKLGDSLGLSHTTIRNYLGLLSHTYMLRLLPPLATNLKKRLVKAPKIYLRDSGILHALLDLKDMNTLLGHPVFGSSWEGLCLENILGQSPDSWRASYYRTAAGVEIDLILETDQKRLAFEFKASKAPKVNRSFWGALHDLGIEEAYVVAPVSRGWPIGKNAWVLPLEDCLQKIASHAPLERT